MTPVQKLLARAAERISAPGTWCQGASELATGARCAAWAITCASGGQWGENIARKRVETILDGHALTVVNDSWDTIHGDMSTLLALAACLDEGEVP